MENRIFISYSNADKIVATSFVDLFENNGIKCWTAPRDIVPGKDYGEEIMNGIMLSKFFILIFTKNANSSKHVKREVERALHFDKIIVPLKIDDTIPTGGMEYYLSTLQWLDAQEENKYQKVLKDASNILGVAIERDKVITGSEIIVPGYLTLNICTRCGNQYAEHDPSGCSYHPLPPENIGHAGPDRDFAERWNFPCCGQKYIGTFKQIDEGKDRGIYDTPPPASPGCNRGYHTPKYLFTNRGR